MEKPPSKITSVITMNHAVRCGRLTAMLITASSPSDRRDGRLLRQHLTASTVRDLGLCAGNVPGGWLYLRRDMPCVTNAEGNPSCRQVSSLMRCCTRDEGLLALRSRPAGGGFKPPHAALAEDRRGER